MLSDADVAGVTIALALCLVHKNNRHWIKERYKLSPQHTRTRAHTYRLRAEQAKRLQNSFLCDSTDHQLMGHSRLLLPQSLKKF
jgi:hypothetical protein